jgi:oligopeptide/dipeptide ABC transporter ATP-binding protein
LLGWAGEGACPGMSYHEAVSAPLLEVRNLSVQFPVPGRAGAEALTALREVSFSIAPGEVLGLVGESGSGKSVTSLALMGLLPPQARTSGQAEFTVADKPCVNLLSASGEQLRAMRGSRMAMIFQEPMTALNPVMRVGDQVAEAVLAHSPETSKKEAGRRAVEALREVALPEPEKSARDYPHQLSGGMRQRVMIAMAIVNRPQLLIADEPTTALDVTIQAQILQLLQELRVKFNLAMLFISHDLAVVSRVADRVAVMYAGSLVEMAKRDDIFQSPAHPYTRGLLRAVPTLRTDRSKPLSVIDGSVPQLRALPPGCLFEPRCELRVDSCSRGLPPLVEVSRGHWSRCPVTLTAVSPAALAGRD